MSKAKASETLLRFKYEEIGREFMRSLDVWDAACAAGKISTEEERRNVMWETIRKARKLGLLEEPKS